MSVRVTDDDAASLYDSVTGRAFGPVFESQADASDFLDWLNDHHGIDAREVPLYALDTLVSEWAVAREEDEAA